MKGKRREENEINCNKVQEKMKEENEREKERNKKIPGEVRGIKRGGIRGRLTISYRERLLQLRG